VSQVAPYIREVTTVDEGVILALWRQDLDTLSIAQHLHLTEAQVYNRLWHLRQTAETV
jgi:hypothetical protein